MGFKHRWSYESSADNLVSSEAREFDLSVAGRVNILVVFLGPYSLGMSNLGFLTVHRLLNLSPGIGVERFFFPLEQGVPSVPPLYSFETRRPLGDFHIFAFSLSFEGNFDGLPPFFGAMGIPINAECRTSKWHPLFMAGGAAVASNSKALSRVFDVLIPGEAETVLPEILNRFSQEEIDAKVVADLPGVWVPSVNKTPNPPSRVHDLALSPAYSHIVSSKNVFGGAQLLEVMRGCPRSCAFCLARKIYFPPRPFPFERFVEFLDKHSHPSWGLIAPSLFDHPEIHQILESLGKRDILLRNSSAKWEKLTPQILTFLRKCGVSGLTLAPETGSSRLLKEMGKILQQEAFFDTLETVISHGFLSLKLYFMVGLPSETTEDLEATLLFIEKIHLLERGRLRDFVVGFSGFIPKSGTPWENYSVLEKSELKFRFGYIKKWLQKFVGKIKVRFESPREIVRQAYLAKVGPEFIEELEKEALEWRTQKTAKEIPLENIDF